jgi:hypothetical protein
MDKAIVGACRADYCRADVYRDDWDRLLAHFKNLSIKQIGTDPPILGWCRLGYTYFDVQYGLFQDLKKKMENV